MDWRSLLLLVPLLTGICTFKLPETADESTFLEEYSSYMNGNMDKSIDPCKDFHRFACGNYKNNRHLGDVEKSTFVFRQLQNNTFVYIRKVLSESNDEILKIPKQYLQKCLSYNVRERFLDMDEILESTEMFVEDWRNLTFDGVEELLHMTTFYSEKKQSIYLSWSKLRSAYEPDGYKLIENIFGQSIYYNYSEQEYNNVQRFIKEFQELLEKSQVSEEKFTIKTFKKRHSAAEIDWDTFFYTVSRGILKESSPIFTAVKDFEPILKFLRNTDPKVIFNYIKWTKVLQDFPFLIKNLPNENMWKKFCTEEVMTKFKFAIASVVFKELVDSESRSDLLEIAGAIRDQLYYRIDDFNWLDDYTKSFVKTVVNALEIYVGYTDDSIDRDLMRERQYQGLEILEEDDFLEMIAKILHFNYKQKFTNIGYPMEITDYITVLIPNAHSIRDINSIAILATYMQLPIYNKFMPQSLKYGGIGSVIGHEISHDIDGSSFFFDYNNVNRYNVIGNFSKNNFYERSACFESQYNKFYIKDFVNNGSHTLSENMADNGGIRLSYDAYVEEVGNDILNSYQDQRVLLNLRTHFTNKQMFFLSVAQMRCNSLPYDQIKFLYEDDEHPYDKFRVNGMLSNMEEFSEAFECPLGSNMNPLTKCDLW